MNIDPHIVDLVSQLAEIGIRNTAVAVGDKVRAARAKKDTQQTINELVEIINSLITDKDTLYRIGKGFEEELVAQRISQKDIEYITKSFIPVLRELIKQTPNNQTSPAVTEVEKFLDFLTPLLSVEMLTVLQLVGFNFKKAIGEPLTLLLQKAITSRVPADPQSNLEYPKMLVAMNTKLLEIAQDEEATERWERLKSNGIIT